MASFLVYSTSDTNRSDAVLDDDGAVTLGPIQAGRAQKLVGSVFADQAGVLKIQQTFDGINWDVTQSFTIVANTPQTVDIDVIAGAVQAVYTNGSTPQGVFRLFLRAFESGST